LAQLGGPSGAMGATLSAPVELTRVQRHGSKAFRCGVAEMQGWRNTHEDAHEVACGDTAGAFWVLDGHGGDAAAKHGAVHLAKEFEEELASGGATLPTDERIAQGLAAVDVKLRERFRERAAEESGSTVIGAMAALQPDGTYTLKLINCGDSRAIVVRGPTEIEEEKSTVTLRVPEHLLSLPEGTAEEYQARTCRWPLVQETVDHKPSHPTEKGRIEAAGGTVTQDAPPRLDGNLAVSRGLGDFEYKRDESRGVPEQKVSCVPDIYEVKGLKAGSLVILCCDGVWDVMTGEAVGESVRGCLEKKPATDLGDIAATIVKESLEKSSRDNVTAMVVRLSGGEDWATPQPDEMQCFGQLASEERLDDEVKNACLTFLSRGNFGAEPLPCVVCSKWFASMHQCGCQTIIYCGKACQKKHWKTHKSDCPAAKAGDKKAGPDSDK